MTSSTSSTARGSASVYYVHITLLLVLSLTCITNRGEDREYCQSETQGCAVADEPTSDESICHGRESIITAAAGHWPYIFFTATDIYLIPSTKQFHVSAVNDKTTLDLFNKKIGTWQMVIGSSHQSNEAADERDLSCRCHQQFQEAYIFTVYYWHGSSNYFHIFYDTAIPIYSLLQEATDKNIKDIILLPSVEMMRMKPITWETDAFLEHNNDKYWMQILSVLTGVHGAKLLPLDSKAIHNTNVLCFKKAYFGVPKMEYKQSEGLLRNFTRFVKEQLGTAEPVESILQNRLRVGLIKRSNRRLILNNEELIDAVRDIADMELIIFEWKSFSEQVELVQKYDILVGMNGAGLMNAIFRREGSVAVQLVPYEATQLNFGDFGTLLKAQGPYLEWHNKHKELTKSGVGDSRRNSQADTIVHVQEFVTLIQNSIELYQDYQKSRKNATVLEEP
ncbi:PREDICTED: uncharacterized protein LOC106807479 [Priapulus caudatus]|uniref:Uncharacterized protein LOC106807479 n=1 Tax=Priapulus caudatus TaxID=37621 RepID=A0ABM1DZC6_PRICU|nr:PREDICTED: uncharacterized protein LOC106807479 [Priapulus caudatus]